jgi:arsenate reductase-like glutaredoxin family protein
LATVDAKKEVHQKSHALELLSNVSRLHAAKGKKVVLVDLKKDGLSEEEILKLVLGPTGNLRAPTLRVGKTLVVGFNEEMYESILS